MRYFKCSDCEAVSVTSREKPTAIACTCGGWYEIEISKEDFVNPSMDNRDNE